MENRFYLTSLKIDETDLTIQKFIVLELRLKDDEFTPESKLALPFNEELFNFFRGVFHDSQSFILNLEDISSMMNSAY